MKSREKEKYISSLKNFSDRELLELQTYYARKTSDNAKSISGIVNFCFFLVCISIAIALIGFAIGAN